VEASKDNGSVFFQYVSPATSQNAQKKALETSYSARLAAAACIRMSSVTLALFLFVPS
jgi:hypothetical protein